MWNGLSSHGGAGLEVMRRLLDAQPEAFVTGSRDDILRVLELAVMSQHDAVGTPLCAVVARLFTAFPITRPSPDMPAAAQAVLTKVHELLTHHLLHSANPAARLPLRHSLLTCMTASSRHAEDAASQSLCRLACI